MKITKFTDYPISAPILRALEEMGFTQPSDIQELVLPVLLEGSGDLVAQATTGSGKTAAFGIPLIERVDANSKSTQALILCPTRELAVQVAGQIEAIGKHMKLRVATLYGGAPYPPQERALRAGPQIIIATPGRLIDFLKKKKAQLDELQTLVLDEADEMISMGFKEDLESILASASKDCRRWMFSATMSRQIREISKNYLKDPRQISLNPQGGASATIQQVYYTVQQRNKTRALCRILQTHPEFYGIIFCQMKSEVDELTEALKRRGFGVDSLHGDRTQSERERVMRRFRQKEVTILVATDVAARGLDIKELTHVINHSVPRDVESYIHRIGRTGRNGQLGIALSLVSPDQLYRLANIQRATKTQMTRGHVPSGEDVLNERMNQILASALFSPGQTGPLQATKRLISNLLAKKEFDLESLSKEELIARFALKSLGPISQLDDEDLDYLPADKTPRELTGGGHREGRENRGGRRGPRGGFRAGSARGSKRERQEDESYGEARAGSHKGGKRPFWRKKTDRQRARD